MNLSDTPLGIQLSLGSMVCFAWMLQVIFQIFAGQCHVTES